MGARRYIFPNTGDSFATIAARELPGVEGAEQELQSWNLHLAARAGFGRSVGLLPSDVVFTEPPVSTKTPSAHADPTAEPANASTDEPASDSTNDPTK
jgi:hypothetical protein